MAILRLGHWRGFNGNGCAQDLSPFKSLSLSHIEQAVEEATVQIVLSVETPVVSSQNNVRTSLLTQRLVFSSHDAV